MGGSPDRRHATRGTPGPKNPFFPDGWRTRWFQAAARESGLDLPPILRGAAPQPPAPGAGEPEQPSNDQAPADSAGGLDFDVEIDPIAKAAS